MISVSLVWAVRAAGAEIKILYLEMYDVGGFFKDGILQQSPLNLQSIYVQRPNLFTCHDGLFNMLSIEKVV